MNINNNSNIYFGQVFVKSKDAEKLLRKADRAIKASSATFVDTNIPEGHKKPLWSVLSNYLSLRQASNPNHILIDVSDKSKQILCVKTLDNKGFVTTKVDVSPMPEYGTKNEFFHTSDLYKNYVQSMDTTQYGRSNFFNVIDNAEYEVDMLLEEQIKNRPVEKYSLKILPKQNQKKHDTTLILNPKRIEKSKMKLVEHVQRPFEDFKRLLNQAVSVDDNKLKPSKKIRVPRNLKKVMKKQSES